MYNNTKIEDRRPPTNTYYGKWQKKGKNEIIYNKCSATSFEIASQHGVFHSIWFSVSGFMLSSTVASNHLKRHHGTQQIVIWFLAFCRFCFSFSSLISLRFCVVFRWGFTLALWLVSSVLCVLCSGKKCQYFRSKSIDFSHINL